MATQFHPSTSQRLPVTFLNLPAEIRLHIYAHLLFPDLQLAETSTPIIKIRTLNPDRYPCLGPFRRTRYFVTGGRLRCSTLPTTYHLDLTPIAQGNKDDDNNINTNTNINHHPLSSSSYGSPQSPPHPSILLTCRKTYAEASHLLYSRAAFDFGSDVEAVVPFLSDLTEANRQCVRRISVVKRASPYYARHSDATDWRQVCVYLARECAIQELDLRVSGGKVPKGQQVQQFPGSGAVGAIPVIGQGQGQGQGTGLGSLHMTTSGGLPAQVDDSDSSAGMWDNGVAVTGSASTAVGTTTATTVAQDEDGDVVMEEVTELTQRRGFKKGDFGLISKFEGMEWVMELLVIKNLKDLRVGAIWEVCPPPCSNALAFFLNFSESIENGFAEFLRENMVAGAA